MRGFVSACGVHWRDNQKHNALWKMQPFDRAVFFSLPVDELEIHERIRASTK
jgi:hypothetical protein